MPGDMVGDSLLIQIGSGIADVIVERLLPSAFANNVIGASLLLAVLILIHRISQRPSTTGGSP